MSNTTMTTEVDFIVDGQRHKIEVLDAPTLTAMAFALKAAAGVEYTRHFAIEQLVGEPWRELRSEEAVVLAPDGTTAFMSWPQGIMKG